MNITDIPRVKAGEVAEISLKKVAEADQEDFVLATRAQDLLGYSVLASRITGNPSGASTKTGELAATLLRLDIETLDMPSVLRYQCEEAQRRTHAKLIELMEGGTIKYWTQSYGFTEAKWCVTDLESYKEPVPQFVIRKAIQIKEANPKVTFRVQHLNDPRYDPFLVAILDKEVYYVEVWEEPRFEGRF